MKLDLVKELMKEFETSHVSKMKIEIEGIKLELEKNTGESEHVVERPIKQTIQKPTPQATEDVQEPIVEGTQDTFIKAPLVGVYYASSSPEKEAFVEVGSKVKKGQTLCIIEAMKVMNEIKAPQDGVITSILASNEDLIEFDQIIMTLNTNV